jgi:TolB protein
MLSPRIVLVILIGALALRDDPSPRRLTHDGREKARPMWSPDGSRLTFARHESGGSHIWQFVMDPSDPEHAKRLTARPAPDFHAAFFPDGKRLVLAFVEQSGTQGNLDLSVIGSDGSDAKRVVGDLTGRLSHQDWPSPSPSGSRFAFSSTHDGNQEIYTCKDDGTDVARLTQSPGHDAHPCWSPRGDRIAFATDRWGGLEIASIKSDGTGLTRLTKSPGIDDFPAYSPDGTRLAFASSRGGQSDVYVMSADGSGVVNLTDHPGRDTQPTWTPDGSAVTFVSDRDGGTDLYLIRVVDGPDAGR